MKNMLKAVLSLVVAVGTISCASSPARSGSASPEDRLRQMIRQETDQEIVAIQYESDSGTAVVQLRTRDASGKERLSYRWYVREDDTWILSPYVGAKRPDAP